MSELSIQYRRAGESAEGTRWLVLADGEELGHVEQVRARHGRPTHKGSRIVSRWTYSTKWKATGGGAGVYWDTRWRAAAQLIERKLNLTWSDASDAAKAGRVEQTRAAN